jgi:hypothetical protein
MVDDLTHDFRFRIGDVLPAGDPLARFIVAVADAMNDCDLANSLFVKADKDYERIYFFKLASSHLYEAAKKLHQAYRQWPEVKAFVDSLPPESQEEFGRITALAEPAANWPGSRLEDLRNSFFHYASLDRGAADAGKLPLVAGLEAAADVEGRVFIEADRTLTGIRALFADEIYIKTLTLDFEEGELEKLTAAMADYAGTLHRFAQMAVGRYLRNLPAGVVRDVRDAGD